MAASPAWTRGPGDRRDTRNPMHQTSVYLEPNPTPAEPTDDSSSVAPALFHFSTDDYAPRERVEAWREEFGRTLLRVDLTPRSTDRFRANATACRMANFGMLRAATSAVN